MIIDKLLLCFPTGLTKVSKRLKSPRAITFNEAAIMYAIRRCPVPTFKGVHRFIEERRTFDSKTYHRGVSFLVSIGYIEKRERLYYLTPQGLEFMASLRRYLLNIRL